MNEMQVLLESFATLKRETSGAALASIVKVQGSAYRQPGARMLIAPDGRTVGSISAGCLDRDVCERAQKVIAADAPVVATYDTTAAGDDVWGLGLGCAGLVEVLIEPLGQDAPANHVLTFLGERFARRDVGVVVTVFRTEGAPTPKIGSRLMLTGNGEVFSTLGDPRLAEQLADEAKQTMREGRSRAKEFGLENGKVEALLEAILPPVPLVIFGAGDDAVPLSRLAKEIGWDVTVADSRSGYATPERFPSADTIVVVRPEAATQSVPVDDRTVAVVMTHNYAQDLELLKWLLPSPVRYLGILGARNRTAAMLRTLRDQTPGLREHHLEKVYSPIGLDIGAETPGEIALAILAEIRAVTTGRRASFLRDRQGPIHDGIGDGIAAPGAGPRQST